MLRNLFSHVLFLVNLLAAAWLGLCYAASVTSPAEVRHLALFSLTTPFAIAVNAGFMLFWLFTRRKWRALLSGILLILLHRLAFSVFGIHYFGKNDLEPRPGYLKVMTWNVHGLGIYDRPANRRAPDRMLALIREERPDILCLPEFYTDWSDAMKPHSNRFLKEGNFREYRFINDNSLGTRIHIGTAFYSRYPLHNFREIQLAEYIKMMQCDVELPGKQMMRTYFIHLQSFLLLDKDKKMIEEINIRDKNIPIEASRTYAGRFHIAYLKRAAQAEKAAEIIAQSPYPVLICGDLNDLPGSYTYTTIRGRLLDAFAQKGRGPYLLRSPAAAYRRLPLSADGAE
jgi:endonuclease/exonuclease/phosphatase family metal-dependent hydrolase